MLSRIFKKTTPIRLGRWAVTNDVNVQEYRINWANHDHCGSEICEKKFTKEKKEKKEKKTKVNMAPFDELLPFCI
tara:strand:+ start:176 stop:400 length:225 start_codon:yes stop_codon:yes gene_type:complete